MDFKQINISSTFLPGSLGYTILVFSTKRHGNIPMGTPLTARGRRMQVQVYAEYSEPIMASLRVVNAAPGQVVLSTRYRQTVASCHIYRW